MTFDWEYKDLGKIGPYEEDRPSERKYTQPNGTQVSPGIHCNGYDYVVPFGGEGERMTQAKNCGFVSASLMVFQHSNGYWSFYCPRHYAQAVDNKRSATHLKALGLEDEEKG